MLGKINKEWMNEKDRLGPEYTEGVKSFLEFANTNNVHKLTTLPCPCVKCRNRKRQKVIDVRNHLIRVGIDKSYTVWALHGEKSRMNSIEHSPIEHGDGTVLESAKIKYGEVAVNKRKEQANEGEGCSDTYDDHLDTNALSEVFGQQTKGGVRAVGSHITKKQLIHMGVTKSKVEENNKAMKEAAKLKDEILSVVDSRLDSLKDILLTICSKISNGNSLPLVSTPSSDMGSSNSVNRPSHLSQNLDNVFGMIDVTHSPSPTPIHKPLVETTGIDKPRVILNDKFGKQLAKGYVVTDATAKVCHLKNLGIGEKKVYVEEVFEPDARLYDAPQEGHDTLASFVEGGFVIWLDCWLTYL